MRGADAVALALLLVEGEQVGGDLRGESLPVEKQAGAAVMSGTLNKTGAFSFRATQVGSETALAQIIRLVEEAQASKAPIQKLADWVAGHFILGVHALALAVFLFWFFAGFDLWFSPDIKNTNGVKLSEAVVITFTTSLAAYVPKAEFIYDAKVFPNPFRPLTDPTATISYELNKPANVNIKIYNIY